MEASDRDEMPTSYALSDRGAFIHAFNEHSRTAIKELQSIHAQGFDDADRATQVRTWAAKYRIDSIWMLEVVRKTLDRWKRQPQVAESGRLNYPTLPHAQFSAPEVVVTFRGYEDPLETPEQAEERMIRVAKDVIKRQLRNAPPKPDRRRRDDKDPNARFKWLAMSLEPDLTLVSIGKAEGMNRANLFRAIGKARADLGFPAKTTKAKSTVKNSPPSSGAKEPKGK